MSENTRKSNGSVEAMTNVNPPKNQIEPDELNRGNPAQEQHKSDNTNNEPKAVSILWNHFF